MWRNGKCSYFALLCFIGSWLFNIHFRRIISGFLADGVMKLVSKGDKEEADMNIDTTPSPDPTATPTISDTDTAAGL